MEFVHSCLPRITQDRADRFEADLRADCAVRTIDIPLRIRRDDHIDSRICRGNRSRIHLSIGGEEWAPELNGLSYIGLIRGRLDVESERAWDEKRRGTVDHHLNGRFR